MNLDYFSRDFAVLAQGTGWLVVISAVGLITITLLLAITLSASYGLWRGGVIAGLRGLWLAPMLLLLLPPSSEERPSVTVKKTLIAVLIDDSSSMKSSPQGLTLRSSPQGDSDRLIRELQKFCQSRACELRTEYGSELHKGFTENFTPLGEILDPWLEERGPEQPWLILTDGGAMNPHGLRDQLGEHNTQNTSLRDSESLTDQPLDSGSPPRFVVGWWHDSAPNISLTQVRWDPFGFATQPLGLSVTINRNQISPLTQSLQVRVSVDGHEAIVENVTMESHSRVLDLDLLLPPLEAGTRSIQIHTLPLPGEIEVWDNTSSFSIDILPHSIGVLHLSGSPLADGRFLRRFLKNDPRFDVISFFILRDPWDPQAASERELSLIPFPVSQLFEEELPHFKVVVMQNFRLSEFISPDHQNRLIEYVKKGGSLLFLGGPRAFSYTDLQYTPLGEILPFNIIDSSHSTDSLSRGAGVTLEELFAYSSRPSLQQMPGLPWYDPDREFIIQNTPPPLIDGDESLPATTLRQALGEVLAGVQNPTIIFKGRHRMEEVQWKKSGWLGLWSAVDQLSEDNPTSPSPPSPIPLVGASFIGAGRIMWVFSDALWQMAMASGTSVSRDLHHQLFYKIFRWLSRDEKNPPLSLNTLEAEWYDGGTLRWSATLSGAGVPYLLGERGETPPRITLCDREIVDVRSQQLTTSSVRLWGLLDQRVQPQYDDQSSQQQSDRQSERAMDQRGPSFNLNSQQQRCRWKLEIQHPQIGSEKVAGQVILHPRYDDTEFPSSSSLLQALAQKTSAQLVPGFATSPLDKITAAIGNYLERQKTEVRPTGAKTTHPYEFFHKRYGLWWFIWLLLPAMEVILRNFWRQRSALGTPPGHAA